MRSVYAKHLPYADGHLARVAADMDVAGEPTIRCVDRGGKLFALEGSHRLALAFERGMVPKIVIVIQDTDESLDAFWDRVAPELPRYDFDHVNVLDLKVFLVP